MKRRWFLPGDRFRPRPAGTGARIERVCFVVRSGFGPAANGHAGWPSALGPETQFPSIDPRAATLARVAAGPGLSNPTTTRPLRHTGERRPIRPKWPAIAAPRGLAAQNRTRFGPKRRVLTAGFVGRAAWQTPGKVSPPTRCPGKAMAEGLDWRNSLSPSAGVARRRDTPRRRSQSARTVRTSRDAVGKVGRHSRAVWSIQSVMLGWGQNPRPSATYWRPSSTSAYGPKLATRNGTTITRAPDP